MSSRTTSVTGMEFYRQIDLAKLIVAATRYDKGKNSVATL